MFCVFSVFMEPEKASTRMKTKKAKMLMSFKSKFCDKNWQTQEFVLNFKILKFEFEKPIESVVYCLNIDIYIYINIYIYIYIY